jgi:flagellar assembly protein FliH
MTLSYRIIKSENLNVIHEGVEVATQIAAKQVKFREEVTSLFDKSKKSAAEILSEEDKKPHVEEFQASLNREKQVIIEKYIKNANEEANKIKEESRHLGFEEGYKDGYSQGEERALLEYKTLITNASDIVKEAEKQVNDYFERQKENLVKLAGQMAEKIVNHEIDTNSETLVDMVKQVLQEYKKGGILVVYCSRKHVRKLKENTFALKKINGDIDYVILENPLLVENRITLEYENQIIDMDIATQIQSMINELLGLEV